MYNFAFELTGLPAIIFLGLLIYVFIYAPIKLIFKLVAHAKYRAERVRKLSSNLIIAEYDPPGGLSPAEIGYLFDTKLGKEEVFATILSLEQMGLVQLDRSQAKPVVVEVKNSTQNLKSFDRYVLSRLDVSKGHQINKHFFNQFGVSANIKINKELNELGYLKPYSEQMRGVAIRIVSISIILLLGPLYIFKPHSLDDLGTFFLFTLLFGPFILFMSVFLYATYNKIAGEPWIGTSKLKQLWPDIEGYREYIKMVAQDQLKFESENTKGIMKNKVLPYAVALGIDTSWKTKI